MHLFQPSVKYYGLCISKEGVSITKEKLEAIHNATHPNNIIELHTFLGLLATLNGFIPNLSKLARPLNELLGNKPWKWNESCEKSFQQLKMAVTTEIVLAHYDPQQKLEMAVDASLYGLGAVIMHMLLLKVA